MNLEGKTLSYKQLVDNGACKDALDWFKDTYGTEFEAFLSHVYYRFIGSKWYREKWFEWLEEREHIFWGVKKVEIGFKVGDKVIFKERINAVITHAGDHGLLCYKIKADDGSEYYVNLEDIRMCQEPPSPKFKVGEGDRVRDKVRNRLGVIKQISLATFVRKKGRYNYNQARILWDGDQDLSYYDIDRPDIHDYIELYQEPFIPKFKLGGKVMFFTKRAKMKTGSISRIDFQNKCYSVTTKYNITVHNITEEDIIESLEIKPEEIPVETFENPKITLEIVKLDCGSSFRILQMDERFRKKQEDYVTNNNNVHHISRYPLDAPRFNIISSSVPNFNDDSLNIYIRGCYKDSRFKLVYKNI
jgi:hypothetical protein